MQLLHTLLAALLRLLHLLLNRRHLILLHSLNKQPVTPGLQARRNHHRIVRIEPEAPTPVHYYPVHALLLSQTRLIRLFLPACRNQHDYVSLALPARSAHPLDQPYGRLLRIVADNQVDLADIQALLAHTRRDQRVVAALAELAHHLQLLLLRHRSPAVHGRCRRRLADKLHGLDGRVCGKHLDDLVYRLAVLAEDHDAGLAQSGEVGEDKALKLDKFWVAEGRGSGRRRVEDGLEVGVVLVHGGAGVDVLEDFGGLLAGLGFVGGVGVGSEEHVEALAAVLGEELECVDVGD